MITASSSPQQKLKIITYGIIATVCIIATRLTYLQIILTNELKRRSELNFLRWEQIPPLRGHIVDTHDTLLVTNRPVIDVCWRANGQKYKIDHIRRELEALSSILGQNLHDDAALIQQLVWAERTSKTVTIASDIDFAVLVNIKEHYADHPSIITTHRFTRYYPHQLMACHILGYLSTAGQDIHGKMGLEKLFNDLLKGEHGKVLKVINAIGKPINTIATQATQAGMTIRTTLNIALQMIAEEIFGQELTGSLIIMDPATGALRSLVSRPAFDPSIFLKTITQTQWQELQTRRPFINRAFDATYPPGSIFKLVTISAALEHHYIDKQSHWYCQGYSTFCDRRYYCHNRLGHGRMSIVEAVANSCNPLFFELGKQMDIDLIASYAHAFGLGEPTGIALSENTGLVPTRAWKRRIKGESWWQGETLSAAIGQSFLGVTPLQVARMISSIFTGYLVTPRILEDEPIVTKKLMIQQETLDLLRMSMRAVVLSGTGRQVNKITDMTIYAKTSTAQTSALEKRDTDTRYREHGWFVCHVQYKQEEPLVIVILLENVGTSRASASLANNFLVKYKQYINAKDSAQKPPLTLTIPHMPYSSYSSAAPSSSSL